MFLNLNYHKRRGSSKLLAINDLPMTEGKGEIIIYNVIAFCEPRCQKTKKCSIFNALKRKNVIND